MTPAEFQNLVARAALAPSIHNAQPVRWRLHGDTITIATDRAVTLPVADPTGAGVALSCGAAVEATVLALADTGIGAQVTDHWADNNLHDWSGHRIAARILCTGAAKADGLARQLEHRHTSRGAFDAAQPKLFGWSRADTVLVQQPTVRQQLVVLNDASSLHILARKPFRQELLSWMRLSPGHPRAQHDGMALDALCMTPKLGRQVKLGFGPFWPMLHALGRTGPMTAQARLTSTAPIIACFHRPLQESPIVTGRAYLRLWLEATSRRLAGWPMAALTDDNTAAAQVAAQAAIPPDRTLIQVIRFGIPQNPQPARARRPLSELIP